jgi:glycosyltransferase involved in cell wall biosynthesis
MTTPEDSVFDRIERVFLPKWLSFLNCLLALPGQLPLQVAYYRHSGFRSRAEELMAEHDAVFAHLIRVGDVIKSRPGIKFLEMTDAISLNYNRIHQSGHSKRDLRACIYALEAKRLRSYEQSIIEYFDHSFLVSDIDRQYLFSDCLDKLERVSVFSNGVALDRFPYQFDPNGWDMIFIGNMYSLQNFDAAMYMASEILPLIRLTYPDVRLRLIGRIKPEQASKLNLIDGVDVTGEVSSVSDAARGGGVGVCSLRLGAGVQNKVLEYMALGLPVVSTTIGLEGFNARDGKEIIVANDPVDFANEVIRLLRDRFFAADVAKAARIYVESHHSWEAMLAPMLSVIQSHLGRLK